jgi:adenosine deaminase/adenosine deaminase CECR1
MLNRRKILSIEFIFLIAVLLLAGCAGNIDVATEPVENSVDNSVHNANYLATSQYYNELIAGASPKLAELGLFVNLLPKGGDLHHHYSGALYVETYLDWVDKSGYCICRGDECKGRTKAGPEIVPKFGIVKGLLSGVCISAENARTDKTQAAFYRELLERWSNKDYANHFHEQAAPDQQFFDTFGFFGPVSDYSYREGLLALKQRAIAENVAYLETMLKSAPAVDAPDRAKPLNGLNAQATDQQLEQALSAYFDFMSADPGVKAAIDRYVGSHDEVAAGIDDGQFTLRFQAYVSRNSDPAKVFSGLYAAFSAAKQSPLIVGVNMVGPENGYVAMRDYSLHMKMLRFLKQRFPDVKLALHAGELALGMVPPEGLKHHINEAVRIAGAERLGHAVDITHEADAYDLLDLMKKRNTAVEINLTSNAFILGVENQAHPLLLYRRYAVPFVISTDDPGVSRNNLSHEYLLFTSRYKPSYDELKTVVYNSIHHAFLNEDEKRSVLRELDRRFAVFEAEIASRVSPKFYL